MLLPPPQHQQHSHHSHIHQQHGDVHLTEAMQKCHKSQLGAIQGKSGWVRAWRRQGEPAGPMATPTNQSTNQPTVNQRWTWRIPGESQLWKEFPGFKTPGSVEVACPGCVPVRCVETTLYRYNHIYLGCGPPPRMPVTTRIITYLVADSYKPSFNKIKYPPWN